jgi:hypothetical protein
MCLAARRSAESEMPAAVAALRTTGTGFLVPTGNSRSSPVRGVQHRRPSLLARNLRPLAHDASRFHHLFADGREGIVKQVASEAVELHVQ